MLVFPWSLCAGWSQSQFQFVNGDSYPECKNTLSVFLLVLLGKEISWDSSFVVHASRGFKMAAVNESSGLYL